MELYHYDIEYIVHCYHQCDGDVLNVFRIIGEYFAKEFAKCLNPRYNMYISRIDGKINMECVPFKDEAAAFYQFNNI